MITYILGSDAELDLDQIWEYIATDSIEAAGRWIDPRRPYQSLRALLAGGRVSHHLPRGAQPSS